MLRIHASYHKCLTMFFLRTCSSALNKTSIIPFNAYKHFESIEGLFYNQSHNYYLSSINSFALNTNNLSGDYKITRFIRDPRDLIISGYFYHKRGAEPWFRFKNPTQAYWAAINGNVPKGLKQNSTFAEYLNSLTKEDGILAEMEFRKFHLESMLDWSDDDPNIKLFKYEDVINNQVSTMEQIVDHLEIHGVKKKKILFFANRYALKNRKNDKHIRDPKAGQWKDHFTEEMNEVFIANYGKVLEKYNYPKY